MRLDSKITYTSLDLDKHFVNRHSYIYINLTGGYEVANNYWLLSEMKLHKLSMSNNASFENIRATFWPQFYFSGSPQDLVFQKPGNTRLIIKIGTIPDFRHGYGLLYSEFTGFGSEIIYDMNFASIKVNSLGSGYYHLDDVRGAWIYSWRKYFGIGILSETKASMADRYVPGISSEFTFLDHFTIYSEAATQIITKRYAAAELENKFPISNLDDNQKAILFSELDAVQLNEGFDLTSENVSALGGLRLKYDKIPFWKMKIESKNEIRYYGRRLSEFYAAQKYIGFTYYTDLNSDLKNNNQPFNFYLFTGRTIGLYFSQRITINPWYILNFGLRNEILYIETRILQSDGTDTLKVTGNIIATVEVFLSPHKNIDFGVSFSNSLIGLMEKYNIAGEVQAPSIKTREPLLIEAASFLMVDFFLKYHF